MADEFQGEHTLEQLGAAAEQLGNLDRVPMVDDFGLNGDGPHVASSGKKRTKTSDLDPLDGEGKKPKKTRQTRE